ncbi:MAG: capsular polysaccharide biosynthesis protein [Hyphomicrobiaceae bacterium]|nr:capsular polysaccharide biosynthesis protein [Hyphomicrobiaceae bacterium]
MRDARLAVMSAGMREIGDLISAASGCTIVSWQMGLAALWCDGIAGWGHKVTADAARLAAARFNVPYVAVEDGWLRSIHAGATEKPRSLVVDKSGIYYNAGQPSDLEKLITTSALLTDMYRLDRARRGIELLRSAAISKYNNGAWLTEAELGLDVTPRRPRVLVVDQTRGDASISLGLASEASFRTMLAAAVSENPGAEVIVKTHPEVVSGRKAGYLGSIDGNDIAVVADAVNPWALLEAVDKVYVVTSQLGFEALMCGCRVTCFGAPFYAGWGLTDDRVTVARRTARPTLEQVFAAAYFDYAVYLDPSTGHRVTFEDTVAALQADRQRLLPSWSGAGGAASARRDQHQAARLQRREMAAPATACHA